MNKIVDGLDKEVLACQEFSLSFFEMKVSGPHRVIDLSFLSIFGVLAFVASLSTFFLGAFSGNMAAISLSVPACILTFGTCCMIGEDYGRMPSLAQYLSALVAFDGSLWLISLTAGWVFSTVVAITLSTLSVGYFGFLFIKWYLIRAKTLSKYQSDEKFRLQCLHKYLTEVAIVKGQEEISTLNGQLEVKAKEYTNQLKLELGQVEVLLESDTLIDRTKLEKLRMIIKQKLSEPSTDQLALLQAKKSAQAAQDELAQLNADLLKQINGQTPPDIRNLFEKYLPEEAVFTTPSVSIWETFTQRYKAIAQERTIAGEKVAKVMGIDRQLTEGTAVERLLQAG